MKYREVLRCETCGKSYYIVRSCHEKSIADKLIEETIRNEMEINDLIRLAYSPKEIEQLANGTFDGIENVHSAVISEAKKLTSLDKSDLE